MVEAADADAEAIAEAIAERASRPTMRFIPAKTEEQLARAPVKDAA